MGRGLQAAGFVQGVTNLIPQLGALTSILPPATLAWKLRLLAEGCRYMEGRCVTAPRFPSILKLLMSRCAMKALLSRDGITSGSYVQTIRSCLLRAVGAWRTGAARGGIAA